VHEGQNNQKKKKKVATKLSNPVPVPMRTKAVVSDFRSKSLPATDSQGNQRNRFLLFLLLLLLLLLPISASLASRRRRSDWQPKKT
jgi:hypothetical protein